MKGHGFGRAFVLAPKSGIEVSIFEPGFINLVLQAIESTLADGRLGGYCQWVLDGVCETSSGFAATRVQLPCPPRVTRYLKFSCIQRERVLP